MTNEPTKAQMLAGIVRGSASMEEMYASVLRSHRFPFEIFIQIENLASIAQVPVSVIINQLLECGLESVAKELPNEVVRQLSICTTEQMQRKVRNEVVSVKSRKSTKSK